MLKRVRLLFEFCKLKLPFSKNIFCGVESCLVLKKKN